MIKKIILFIFTSILTINSINAQKIDYANPKKYEIAEITIGGIKYLNHNALVQLSGLRVGQEINIPGDAITKAIRNLWKQGLFSDVKIYQTKIENKKIYLEIFLQERPKISEVIYTGLKKAHENDIIDMVEIKRGGQVTANLLNNTSKLIKDFFADKGYPNTEVDIIQKNDTSFQNAMKLYVNVDKGMKIKIDHINIEGNTIISDNKLLRSMKETKRKRWYGLFKPSKFIEKNYIEDKNSLIAKYTKEGYRDVKITTDSVYNVNEELLGITIRVNEGLQYFFRTIKWVGNTKYSSEQLSHALKIEKGDIFNQEELNNRLSVDEDAVGNIYMDDGYLFYNCTPTEVLIDGDSIDIEMRIYEGKQARINEVIIVGNTRTNDHVVRREIWTFPGELFSKADIIRSIRELAQLGHFDPEQIIPTPLPNQADGTVDLRYSLVEKANDQVEISGGWGAGMVVGTLGLSFNNFSTRNFFEKESWQPLPTGDGQKLSIRGQTNGDRYQSYNLSFVEPWLGGRKPNSLTVSIFHTLQTNGLPADHEMRSDMTISGAAIGFGRRLKKPDNFFQMYHELSFQQYGLNNWSFYNILSDGASNNLSLKTILSRKSIDNPIFSRGGSDFTLGLETTFPYSLVNGKDYTVMENAEKYEWIEYHKWTFKASWFTRIYKDLILNTKFEYGYLGFYNNDIGPSPFEGFDVGGDGMGYYSYGKDIIGLRGYENGTLTSDAGGNLYNKFVLEMRYPITLKESASIYVLSFVEAGNSWYSFKDYSPYGMKRSAGVGLRVFLPMLGMLGLDWAYGFDTPYGQTDISGAQFHFILGQNF